MCVCVYEYNLPLYFNHVYLSILMSQYIYIYIYISVCVRMCVYVCVRVCVFFIYTLITSIYLS